MQYFIKGFVIGFCIAVPVGPIGVLCINRVLQNGFLSGVFTGLGAAMADGVYGLIAGFGLTYISNFLLNQRSIISLLGGLFVIYLGLTTWRTQPPKDGKKEIKNLGLIKNFSSTFILTITNPMTILFFSAIFAGLGIFMPDKTSIQALSLVSGVITGSLCWWLILAISIRYLSKHAPSQVFMKWTNRISGLILIVFGGGTLMTLMHSFI